MAIGNLLTVMRKRYAREVSVDGLVTFLNPYSYVIARRNPDLFDTFDTINCDGISLQIAMRLLGVPSVRRLSFDMTSVANDVLSHATRNGLGVYILGTTDDAVRKAVGVFQDSFDGLRVCGYRNGFFHDKGEREQAIATIVDIAPDIVIVGMGTPLQEQFLVDLRTAGWNGAGFTCGGFLHQTASHGIQYYPKWVDRLHLRWLYRMKDEPRRLTKRYAVSYPLFVLLLAVDWLRDLRNGASIREDEEVISIPTSERTFDTGGDECAQNTSRRSA